MAYAIKIALLLAFTLLAAFLLKEGITGWVISQSCCFPPNCPLEDVCSSIHLSPLSDNNLAGSAFKQAGEGAYERSNGKEAQEMPLVIASSALFLLAFLMLALHLHPEMNKRTKRKDKKE